jgi:putative transposase
MEVERLRNAGSSRTAAVKFIVKAARTDSLPEHLKDAAVIANARKGSTRKGFGERSLQSGCLFTRRPGQVLSV